MGQQNTPRNKHGDFEVGERTWFMSFEPTDFEDDGRHALNGLPRALASECAERGNVPPASPQLPQQLPWVSVACFGLVGLTLFALLATLAV